MVVVVSWPANSSVTAWSRTTPAGSGDPLSSVAASSNPSTPRPGISPAPALVDLRAHERVEPLAGGDRASQRRPGQRQQLEQDRLAVDRQRLLERLRQRSARVPRWRRARAARATRSAAPARGSSGRPRASARRRAPRPRPPPPRSSSRRRPRRNPDGTPAASASGSRGGRRRRCSASRRRAAATGPRTALRAMRTRRSRSTRIWWLTSAPTAHTIGSCSRRIVNTGPKRRSCSSSSPSGSEMIRRVFDQLGACSPAAASRAGEPAARAARRRRSAAAAASPSAPGAGRADRARRG